MTTNDTNDAKLIAIDPGRVAQSVAHLIDEPEVPGSIPPTSCLLPLIQEEHYWRKHVHEVLVNR